MGQLNPKYPATYINHTHEKIKKEGTLKSRFVGKGELILSNSMNYGKPITLGIGGYIHDGGFVLRSFEDDFIKEYLIHLLSSEYVQKQFKRLATGGVVDNISSELVNVIKLNHPTLPEQQKIASFLTAEDKRIALLEEQIENRRQFKQGLLQQMFL